LIVMAFILGLAVFVFAAVAQPAQAGSLHLHVIEYLESQGITPAEGDFTIQDNSDGQGPFVARWDEGTLGPEPTLNEIQAFPGAFPSPPTDAEIIDQTWEDNPLIRAMILRDARRGNKTVQQILDELKTE
ncbi:hypothetical protein LCGC14_1506660, partial [marine sediment metagenome]